MPSDRPTGRRMLSAPFFRKKTATSPVEKLGDADDDHLEIPDDAPWNSDRDKCIRLALQRRVDGDRRGGFDGPDGAADRHDGPHVGHVALDDRSGVRDDLAKIGRDGHGGTRGGGQSDHGGHSREDEAIHRHSLQTQDGFGRTTGRARAAQAGADGARSSRIASARARSVSSEMASRPPASGVNAS